MRSSIPNLSTACAVVQSCVAAYTTAVLSAGNTRPQYCTRYGSTLSSQYPTHAMVPVSAITYGSSQYRTSRSRCVAH
eukprot:871931-Rhodomonas_salina.1